MPRIRRLLLACLPITFAVMAAPAAAATTGAEMEGSAVVSWGRVEVRAGPELAFAVLTDYDRMAEFLPGMLASEVVSRHGNQVVVEQTAEEGVLFFTQRVVVRLSIVEQPPWRLVIRALAGSFKELDGTYQLSRAGDRTLVEYRARFIPDFSLPPVLGTYAVQRSLERHLEALAQEIDRRAGGEAGGSRFEAPEMPRGE